MTELDDEDDNTSADEWARDVLFEATFSHAAGECIGYTLINDGRARCHLCGWSMSARIDDRDGRFAFAALATIGAALAAALAEPF